MERTGAVGLSSNYVDVGTGDDSTSARGSSRSVLNHGRQQRRNVLRQTSSTNRRRLSRQTATKGVMYSFTIHGIKVALPDVHVWASWLWQDMSSCHVGTPLRGCRWETYTLDSVS